MDNKLVAMQNDVVNAVPLPSQGAPMDTVPIGDGFYGGSAAAMERDDDMSWMQGGMMQIRSQEDFDALRPEQKEVVRAAVSMGGNIPLDDALAIYREARKSRMAMEPQRVALPDGNEVYKVGEQIIYPADIQKKQMELEESLREREKLSRSEAEKAQFSQDLKKYRGWLADGALVGPGANMRQGVDAVANPDAFAKRWKLNQLVGEQVLASIRKLGANPTEGERKFLMDMQPKISDPKPVWDEYFNQLDRIVAGVASGKAEGGNAIPAGNQSAVPSGGGMKFQSPDEVKAAFKSGKISREEALAAVKGMGMK